MERVPVSSWRDEVEGCNRWEGKQLLVTIAVLPLQFVRSARMIKKVIFSGG
jgi:hypothetical protein